MIDVAQKQKNVIIKFDMNVRLVTQNRCIQFVYSLNIFNRFQLFNPEITSKTIVSFTFPHSSRIYSISILQNLFLNQNNQLLSERISLRIYNPQKLPLISISLQTLINCMKDRAHRKNIQRKLAYYTPSPYTRALARYMQTTAKTIDPLLKSIANRSPHASFFPVFEFLRAAARLFMLQQIELLVMAYRFETKGWEVDDQIILRGADCMGELFSYPSQRNEYRQVTLYILLVCYWSKIALNEDCSYLLDEVKRICHNFNYLFQEWTNSEKSKFEINPYLLNRLYRMLSSKTFPQYHFIVDQIVQLSHAYNSDKDHNQEKKRSYSVCQRQSSSSSSDLLDNPIKKIKVEVSFSLPSLYNNQQILKDEIKEEQINIFGHGKLGQSQKLNRFLEHSLSASLHFPSIQYSYKPEMDLDYIQVGLCQGQSADLMVLNPVDSTLPSTILGYKGVSMLQNSMFDMREISIIQLKDQSELLQKQLKQKAASSIQKK